MSSSTSRRSSYTYLYDSDSQIYDSIEVEYRHPPLEKLRQDFEHAKKLQDAGEMWWDSGVSTSYTSCSAERSVESIRYDDREAAAREHADGEAAAREQYDREMKELEAQGRCCLPAVGGKCFLTYLKKGSVRATHTLWDTGTNLSKTHVLFMEKMKKMDKSRGSSPERHKSRGASAERRSRPRTPIHSNRTEGGMPPESDGSAAVGAVPLEKVWESEEELLQTEEELSASSEGEEPTAADRHTDDGAKDRAAADGCRDGVADGSDVSADESAAAAAGVVPDADRAPDVHTDVVSDAAASCAKRAQDGCLERTPGPDADVGADRAPGIHTDVGADLVPACAVPSCAIPYADGSAEIIPDRHMDGGADGTGAVRYADAYQRCAERDWEHDCYADIGEELATSCADTYADRYAKSMPDCTTDLCNTLASAYPSLTACFEYDGCAKASAFFLLGRDASVSGGDVTGGGSVLAEEKSSISLD